MLPFQDADVTRALAVELHELTRNGGDGALSDNEQRSRLRALSHKLAFSLEPPEDIVIRQAFMNNVNMCVRVCTDLGVFKILASSSAPLSVSALAKATKAEEQLLVRLMRAVAGINFVEETDLNVYQANKVTACHRIASSRQWLQSRLRQQRSAQIQPMGVREIFSPQQLHDTSRSQGWTVSNCQ